jgi:methionyl aminopeptidase
MVWEEPQVPNFDISDKSLRDYALKPGMVIAIEPMVNAGGHAVETAPDGFTIVTADGSLSAHFEHTIAISDEGPIIITSD